MKTKNILISLAIIIIIAIIAVCAFFMNREKEDENYKVKISYSPSLCEAPIHIAIEKGFFEAEGIEFEAIAVDAPTRLDAAGAGTIDVGFSMVGRFVAPLSNGLPVKVTSGIHTGCIQVLTKQDSGINSIADLRGKKVGVPGLADAQIVVVKRALVAEGINVSDDSSEVEFLVYTAAELAIALENGAVDVIAMSDPTAAIAKKDKGLKTLINTGLDEPFASEYCCVSFITTELFEKHPEIAKKCVEAINKASQWVEDNPEEAARIQIEKGYTTGDVELNGKLLAGYNYKPSVQGGYDALLQAIKVLIDFKIVDPSINAKELADNSFVSF